MITPAFPFPCHLTSSSEPHTSLIQALHHYESRNYPFGPGERQRYHPAAQADGRAAEEAEAHRQGDQARAAARTHAQDLEATSVQARATPSPGPGPSTPAPAPAPRPTTHLNAKPSRSCPEASSADRPQSCTAPALVSMACPSVTSPAPLSFFKARQLCGRLQSARAGGAREPRRGLPGARRPALPRAARECGALAPCRSGLDGQGLPQTKVTRRRCSVLLLIPRWGLRVRGNSPRAGCACRWPSRRAVYSVPRGTPCAGRCTLSAAVYTRCTVRVRRTNPARL